MGDQLQTALLKRWLLKRLKNVPLLALLGGTIYSVLR